MTEKKIVITDIKITYEGYFNCKDLYNLIDKFAAERGYDKNDSLNEVKVKEDGRYILVEMKPNKGISDHETAVLKTKIKIDNMTDEVVEFDDQKLNMNHGKVTVSFEGYFLTETEGDWKSTPRLVLFETLMNKFILREHKNNFEAELKEDVMRLRNEVSAFLNLHKYLQNN